MTKQMKADLSLLGITLIWGASFTFLKQGIRDIPPFTFTAVRFGIGCILLSLVFHEKLKSIDKKAIKAGLPIGLLLTAAAIFQTVGLRYTTASKSGFITGFQTIFVPIIMIAAYKKLPSVKTVIGIVTAIVGLYFLTIVKGKVSINIGDVFVLIAAFCYGLQIIVIDKLGQDVDSIVLTIIEIGIIAIISFFPAVLAEGLKMRFTTSSIISLLFMAILSSTVAYGVQIEAQKYTTPTHTGVIFLGEPVFSAIIGTLFLKETMTGIMLLGCVLIMAGIIISEFSE